VGQIPICPGAPGGVKCASLPVAYSQIFCRVIAARGNNVRCFAGNSPCAL